MIRYRPRDNRMGPPEKADARGRRFHLTTPDSPDKKYHLRDNSAFYREPVGGLATFKPALRDCLRVDIL